MDSLLSTIRTLKKINPNVEIIAISGLPSSDKVNAVYNLGVATFLSKPYTTNQLLKTIDTVIS
jgi:DNA-binding NarL/FixJ family response regulator